MLDISCRENSPHRNPDPSSELHPVITGILAARGITTPSAVRDFLNPALSRLHSPFLLDNMEKAVSKVRYAVENKKNIGIFADSDLDGITSLTLLMAMFEKFNITPYYRYLKNDETYGITPEIIDDFIRHKTELLITVDSGTRDTEAIAYAGNSGIDVIITDHHEQDTALPDAVIVNPKLSGSGYPFRDLAGVGVAFKLLHAVLLSYHPYYMKSVFILAVEDNGSINCAEIFNWAIKSNQSVPDPVTFIDNLPRDSFLVLCGYDINRYPVPGAEKNIQCFSIEYLADHNRTIADIVSFASEKFSIYKSDYSSGIEFFTELFSAIQFNSANKTKSLFSVVLPFVAIGTIADIMPLNNENRILVRNGLNYLGETKHPGLSILVYGKPATAKTVSWDIAPVLNSPGRFGHTSLTVDFFIEKDIVSIQKTLSEIREINEKRRELVNGLFSEIKEVYAEGGYSDYKNITVIKSDNIPDGVAGLIANRVMDISDKPVIVLAKTGSGDLIKGSGRALAGIDFFSYLQPLADTFDKLGGHPQAFGFTIKIGLIESVLQRLDESVISFDKPRVSTTAYDTEIDLNDIDDHLMNQLALIEPFGNGNEEPVFLTRDVEIGEFSYLGKGARHGRFSFNEYNLRAVGWDLGEVMERFSGSGEKVDIYFYLEYNIFRDQKKIQLRLRDITPCSGPQPV
jgi:single-stranded-DNA-specific exonuclease